MDVGSVGIKQNVAADRQIDCEVLDNEELDEVYRQRVATVEMVFESRMDYDTRTDDQPVYVGRAYAGTATSADTWTVRKMTYDTKKRVTRIQVQFDIAWDDRTVGW